MHIVAIRYPRKSGEVFNLKHYLEVHTPAGISLFRKVNGFLPTRVFLQHSSLGLDGAADSSDSYATSWLCFDSPEQVEGFRRVFADAAASRWLIDDMPNYAPIAPTFLVGEMIEVQEIAKLADVGDRQLDELHRTTG